MTYHIRHRYNGIDIIDPEDNLATYIRYQDIPDLVDQLNDAYINSPDRRERELPE